MLLTAKVGAPRHAIPAVRRANGPRCAPKRLASRPVRAFLAAEGEETHVDATVTVHFTLIKQV